MDLIGQIKREAGVKLQLLWKVVIGSENHVLFGVAIQTTVIQDIHMIPGSRVAHGMLGTQSLTSAAERERNEGPPPLSLLSFVTG
jgi:hypothetical protein